MNDPHLGQAVPLDGRLVRRVLQRMSAGQRVWLILDESDHSDVVRVLLAARGYRGRRHPTHLDPVARPASRTTSPPGPIARPC